MSAKNIPLRCKVKDGVAELEAELAKGREGEVEP